MKVVILAGGHGTRISEESHLKPKPMIELEGTPILWHIMKIYSYYGHNDFIICCGYKGSIIKQYFYEYYLHRSDITLDFSSNNHIEIHSNVAEPWRVTLVDTGQDTMTGGRIKRVGDFIGGQRFMLTYGDGLSDVNINRLAAYHAARGRLATMTAIQPGGRFGTLEIDSNQDIKSFAEKRKEDGGWINGGFMVLEPRVLDYIEGDDVTFEKYPLEQLSREGQLQAYKHGGFWQCMDTLRDKMYLEELLKENNAPWKVWEA